MCIPLNHVHVLGLTVVDLDVGPNADVDYIRFKLSKSQQRTGTNAIGYQILCLIVNLNSCLYPRSPVMFAIFNHKHM